MSGEFSLFWKILSCQISLFQISRPAAADAKDADELVGCCGSTFKSEMNYRYFLLKPRFNSVTGIDHMMLCLQIFEHSFLFLPRVICVQ